MEDVSRDKHAEPGMEDERGAVKFSGARGSRTDFNDYVLDESLFVTKVFLFFICECLELSGQLNRMCLSYCLTIWRINTVFKHFVNDVFPGSG
jgi:hypothetical protein